MLVLLRDLMHSRDGCLRLISSLPVVERPRVILKHLQFSKASLWRRNQQLVAWNDPSIYFFPLCLHLPFKDQVSTLSVDPSALFFRISHLLAEKATSFLNDVRAYCSASPVVSLSPLSTQITLLDRQRFEPLVQRACAATSSRICSARQWRLEDVPPEQYPIIVKSALGAGPLVSHYLAVARSPEGVHSFRQHFQELFPQQDDSKWSYKPPRKHLMTAYQLVPHDPPVVYKAFLLGKSLLGNTSASLMSLDSSEAKDYYEVLVRKSLALVKSDLRLDVETSEFLPFATTLMKGGPQQPLRPLNEVLGSDHAMIAASFFKHMAAELQCSTFGVDLLVDTRTNGLVVVDVNFFPSYNNHPNLKRDLKRWVLEEGVGDLKS
ncbi:MAG: hypothetical protein KVP17_005098 [Porospora cf. gigantea B]|nr:MAG: hypothetical protein KVP17_005098 [Porospora cf. gigantea B]